MATACSASRRPAGVSRTRRPCGSIRAVSISRDRMAICCDTVEVVAPVTSATARMDPKRDNSTRYCNRRVSTAELFTISEHNVHDQRVDVNSSTGVY
jgi:hypothetical protein